MVKHRGTRRDTGAWLGAVGWVRWQGWVGMVDVKGKKDREVRVLSDEDGDDHGGSWRGR